MSDPEPDNDLEVLFRRTAPAGTPVDVEALLATGDPVGPAARGGRLPARDPAPRTIRRRSSGTNGNGLLMRRLVAAAAVLVAGTAGLAVWFLPRDAVASFSFAAVQDRMAETQTVTFQETERREGKPAETTRFSVRGASLMRADLPDGNYSITDFAARRSLFVDRQKQRAMLIEGFAPLARIKEPLNLYDRLRNIQKDAVEPLPERTLDGKRAVGFLVSMDVEGHTHQMKVWVDPASKLPLRFEETLESGVERICSGFRFDVALDESLFRFESPEGYELETFGVARLKSQLDDKAVAEPVVTPLVGLGPAKFGMSKDEIIQLLGPPDKIVVQEAGNGSDLLEYYSRGYGLHVGRKTGFLMGSAFSGRFLFVETRPFAGQTDKGIRIGTSEADIRRAYGEPNSVEEPTLREVFGDDTPQPDRKTGQKTLHYDDLRTWFSLHDGKLHEIVIRADVRKLLEGKGP